MGRRVLTLVLSNWETRRVPSLFGFGFFRRDEATKRHFFECFVSFLRRQARSFKGANRSAVTLSFSLSLFQHLELIARSWIGGRQKNSAKAASVVETSAPHLNPSRCFRKNQWSDCSRSKKCCHSRGRRSPWLLVDFLYAFSSFSSSRGRRRREFG